MLKTVNQTDEFSQKVIFDYIRQVERINLFCNVPIIIQFICLLYYYIPEFFTKYNESRIKLDDSKKIMSYYWYIDTTTTSPNTVYGNIQINNNYHSKYIWTIKILSCNEDPILIGIDSSNKEYINNNFSFAHVDVTHYAFRISNGQCLLSSKDDISVYCDYQIKNGDIIQMELNSKDKNLKLNINDIDKGIAFNKIDLNVKNIYFAICIRSNSQSVELFKFERIFINK